MRRENGETRSLGKRLKKNCSGDIIEKFLILLESPPTAGETPLGITTYYRFTGVLSDFLCGYDGGVSMRSRHAGAGMAQGGSYVEKEDSS